MIYVVRAHLNYSPDEWEALPWHWQRTFLEELAEDGKFTGTGGDDDDYLDDAAAAGATVRRG